MSDSDIRSLERAVLDDLDDRNAWTELVSACLRAGTALAPSLVEAKMARLVEKSGAPQAELLRMLKKSMGGGDAYRVFATRRDGTEIRVDGRATSDDVRAGLGPARRRLADAILSLQDSAEVPDWVTMELHEATCEALRRAGMPVLSNESPGRRFGVTYAPPISGTVQQGTRMLGAHARTLAGNLSGQPDQPRFDYRIALAGGGPIIQAGPGQHVNASGAHAIIAVVNAIFSYEVSLIDASVVDLSAFGRFAEAGWVASAARSLATDHVTLPKADAEAFGTARA